MKLAANFWIRLSNNTRLGIAKVYARLNPTAIWIIEYNRCHQEVVAGIYAIANRLGLPITVLVADEHREESAVFYSWQQIKPIYVPYHFIKKLLCESYLPVKVIICTTFDYRIRSDAFDSWLTTYPSSNMYYGILHNTLSAKVSPSLKMLLLENRLLGLSSANRSGQPLPYLPLSLNLHNLPCFDYGKSLADARTWHGSEQKIFVIAGTTGADFQIIIEAINCLNRSRYEEFVVIVVGMASIEDRQLGERVPNLVFAGRVSSDRFLSISLTADFLIAPTDASQYILNGAASGSLQLMRALAKPLVISRQLADFWQLSSSLCIIYDGTRLVDGLANAMSINSKDHDLLIASLMSYNKSCINNSIDVFQNLLSPLPKCPNAGRMSV